MWFRMLGPLEVESELRPVALGGSKQRAVLGCLLFHPRQVVPTSRLLNALWSEDEAPATARKILQNAVWGLRRALAQDEAGGDGTGAPVALQTRAPGYCLQVDPERIDLHQFHRKVSQGRAQLTAGAPEEASRLLEDALALWRGPALSDLVEIGFDWPELTTVQNARLDALEDYFEAQLASGQHYAVLGRIETMVRDQPLRERACGQLMRALYRCGRQADALGVYGRLRTSLVEDLGLEPSRELRLLQQAILTHDVSLQAPRPAARTVLAPAPAEEHGGPALPGTDVWERRESSVLLVRTTLAGLSGLPGEAAADAVLDAASTAARREAERHGGVFAASMGDVHLVLFPAGDGDDPARREGSGPHDAYEAHERRGSHAERAVRAAAAVRERAFALSAGPWQVTTRAAVVSGQAVVRLAQDGATPASVRGSVLEDCQVLLSLVPEGEIEVCERTREASGRHLDYLRLPGTPDRWRVREVPAPADARREGEARRAAGPGAVQEGGYGLDLLSRLLDHTVRWTRPYLATVLGSEACRSRLLTEFRRRARRGAPLLWVDHRVSAGDDVRTLRRLVLAACCGLTPGAPAAHAAERLEAAVRRISPDEARAGRLVALLGPLLDPSRPPAAQPRQEEQNEAWWQFVRATAWQRPLVLVLDDLHLASGEVLDFTGSLDAAARPAPVLVIAAARPELLDHRPGWAATSRGGTTITLDPIPATDSGRCPGPRRTLMPAGQAAGDPAAPPPRNEALPFMTVR